MKKQRKSIEDYLKTIYILSKTDEVHGAEIARELGVSRPTVSVSLKALEEEGYLVMDESRAVHLTERGRAIAEETYGRHVLLCRFFEKLGISAETAAEDACRMEHAVSPESFRALKNLVEHHSLQLD